MVDLVHLLLEYWVYHEAYRFGFLLIYPIGNFLLICLYAIKPTTINYSPLVLYIARVTLMLVFFTYEAN